MNNGFLRGVKHKNIMVMEEIRFEQIVKVGCGIDVHQNLIVASIRKSNDEVETRKFNAYTSSLTSLNWCKQEGITHVATCTLRSGVWKAREFTGNLFLTSWKKILTSCLLMPVT